MGIRIALILYSILCILTIRDMDVLIYVLLVSTAFCLIFEICRDITYKNSIKKLKWKYSKGEKIIYRQRNCYYDRIVGCEVIALEYSKKYSKRNIPVYKVKAYTEGRSVWTINESDIICTAEDYGEFPVYNDK